MAQEQNFKQYLGWGLVGTPSGRQYTSDGIDKQFKFGKTVFELGQDLGGCLPSPKSEDLSPLCAIIYREENNIPILGLASYYSIYEQGQSRAGTYFGSFIEAAKGAFSIASLPAVWDTLSELNQYQVKNFIDWQNKSYRTNNISIPFETPSSLDNIRLEELSPKYLNQAKAADFLFIHCNEGESSKVAEKIILSGLYRQFKDIFFTESEYISSQMRQMKRLQISSNQLFSLDNFILPYQSEVNYLHAYIQKLSKENENANNEIQRLNKEQAQIIQQEVAKNVEIQAKDYQQQRDNAIAEMKKMEEKAKLGDTQLSVFSGEVYQGIANQILPKLSELDGSLKRMNLALQNQSRMQVTEEYDNTSNSSSHTFIWIITSALLFLMLLGTFAWQLFADDPVESFKEKPEYKQLMESSKKLEESQKQVKSFTEKERQQQAKLNDLQRQVKQLCSALDKKQKRDYECEIDEKVK